MKKLVAVILILSLSTGAALTGCSKKEEASDAIESKYTNIMDKASGEGEFIQDDNITSKSESKDNSTSSNYPVGIEPESPGVNVQKKPLAESDTLYSITNADECDTYIYDYTYGCRIIPDNDEFTYYGEAGFEEVLSTPLSTFSIDVDTASYSIIRKDINYGIMPSPISVGIEELLNYFSYDYEEPKDGKPFAIHSEIGPCPWNEGNYLLKVGLQGKTVKPDSLPKSNLVFLIDVSGSMDEEDKLPLLKNAFAQLVDALTENDRISIVVYAGSTRTVLNSVPGSNKKVILNAIKGLEAGGSTAGASGIELAYKLAEKNFIKEGNNRVILTTDGDFNIGPSSLEELEEIITEKRNSGIYLSVLGFGTGNLKDNKMELLADKGNGNYSYIDSMKEAKKVLVDEMSGTLLAIAKDVKIQLEFNPTAVSSYRLIGYETRILENKDFRNDEVDAGELGSGHSVTALYEITPTRTGEDGVLKYQAQGVDKYSDEITEIRLRYKEPDQEDSREIRQVVSFSNTPVKSNRQSADFYFATAVAEFGMLLRESGYSGNATYDSVLELAEKGLGEDSEGYRKEFIETVNKYVDYFGRSW